MTVAVVERLKQESMYGLSVGTRKGNFPLAECNELSGKCFSHTPLGAWV